MTAGSPPVSGKRHPCDPMRSPSRRSRGDTEVVDIEDVAARYQRGISHAENLIKLHGKAGGAERGRRRLEPSLNRAVVVTTVATWQATVQDLATVILESTAPPTSDPHWRLYSLIAGQVKGELQKFSTPNAEKSRALLELTGFDPWPHWSWPRHAGRPQGDVWRPSEVAGCMRDWLKVRHAIAHGDADLPAVDVLEVVRRPTTGSRSGDIVLHLTDARSCVKFFRSLVTATGNGAADHLGVPHPRWD